VKAEKNSKARWNRSENR